MLKGHRKTVLRPVPPTHVDIFAEYYDLLKGWALRFTKHDPDLAEDLLHDAYIHLVLTQPDFDAMENREAYLYVVIRNLHLSQLRRASRIPIRDLSVAEYDTMDIPMWASDPRTRMRLHDDLVTVCQYACIRKESSKAGSVLILRFFHGYYPEEISAVMHASRRAVDGRLRIARGEAREYLDNPDRLPFIDNKPLKPNKKQTVNAGGELRLELRKQIFDSRQGKCQSPEHLAEIYSTEASEGIQTPVFAHIVSCGACLDTVNTLLGLPPLASRFPLDTIGKDPGPKGGSGGGGGAGGSHMFDSYQFRSNLYFHHEPQELCISVNGQLQSYQKVVSGKGELTLIIDTAESVGFVEVFSEQGLRLLMLSVEPPPSGDGEQATHVALSGGRTLDANLDFSGPFPALHVTYNDPELSADAVGEITTAPNVENIKVPFADVVSQQPTFGDRLRSFFDPMRLAVTAALLFAGVFAAWFVMQPTTTEPISARAVLKQARDVEFAMTPTAAKVLHRSYQVEELSNDNVVTKRRIDEWSLPVVNARRTYDENGQMIAGVWKRGDGSQQRFDQGQRLKTLSKYQIKSEPDAEPTIEPTTNGFANVLDRHGVTNRTTIEETPTEYRFTFRDEMAETEQRGVPNRLLVASMTVDRETYHPRSQTLVLQIGDERREYRLTDIRVEQRPIDSVSPAIFLPEPELINGATKVAKPIEAELDEAKEANANATVITKHTATLETEVEVFKLLDAVNALSGEQISVTRVNGQLKVFGVVDSAQRKAEIVNALAPVKNGKGVVVEIETAEESAARKKKTSTTGNISIESVTVATDQSLPVETELRALLTRRGVAADRLEDEMRAFATSVSASSRVLRRNALALKQIAERFTPAEVDRLEPSKREEWKALVRSRARAVAGDVKQLTAQLQPMFSSPPFKGGVAGVSPDGVVVAGGVKDDAAPAAQRLFGLAAACDSQVSQSFAISSGGKGAAPVRSVQFWRSLAQMAGLAAELQKF